MTDMDLQVGAFWRWFIDRRDEFKTLRSPEEPFWDVALERLKRVDDRLWIELSDAADVPREFIVTAEGLVDAFPIAEALVSSAPVIEEWKFLALKPPLGFEFTSRYEGILFEPSRMWFLPLDSHSRPQDLGIRVGIPGLELIDKRAAHNALLVILDTALGERSAATEIQHTEVSELPSDPAPLGYIELPELPTYIAWRKRKRAV